MSLISFKGQSFKFRILSLDPSMIKAESIYPNFTIFILILFFKVMNFLFGTSITSKPFLVRKLYTLLSFVS